ncbi:hypothetical protein IWT5_01312 [Secundilactobacillus silagincola]|uniref:Uncharacterized protein n=1 Tax=Secundilactobacillus silagincola TaxID=1714681 RepID=A0A1Z5J2N2_9LACO|nr:hypothetical protein [Secundilactobacillus silagincola]GAX08159.1 hypothetical protein IWT5_01312 [Secundilactobacillus silagincola]
MKKRVLIPAGILVTGLLSAVIFASPLVHGNDQPTTADLSVPKTVQTSAQTATAAKVTGTTANAKVTYQQSGQSEPTATYQQTTESTAAKAADAVSDQDHNGETVKLSDGTKATEQGVMGHIYVSWQKENWSVTTVTDTTQTLRTDPEKLAAQVNQQLKTNQITNQDVDKGAVTVYSSAQDTTANQIKWQNNKQIENVKGQQAATVYQIAKKAIQ